MWWSKGYRKGFQILLPKSSLETPAGMRTVPQNPVLLSTNDTNNCSVNSKCAKTLTFSFPIKPLKPNALKKKKECVPL